MFWKRQIIGRENRSALTMDQRMRTLMAKRNKCDRNVLDLNCGGDHMDVWLSKSVEVGAFIVFKLYLDKVYFKKGIRICFGNSYLFISRKPGMSKPLCIHPWDHTNPVSSGLLNCLGGDEPPLQQEWKHYRLNLNLVNMHLRVVNGA